MSPTVSLTALLPFRTEAFLAAHRESRSGLTIARRPRPHRMWSTENSRVSAGLRGHRWHSADPNANRTLFPISKRSAGSPAPAVSLGRRALACARGGGRALGARRLPEATRRGGRSAGAPRKRHVRCQRSGKEGERERGERNKEGEESERERERESASDVSHHSSPRHRWLRRPPGATAVASM
ncbi:unnamed protein product [Prorocentrum cordatum]|uniref:Uncharacterized protein n=1 Tax=Prorocentrum cordatum TaxID=2364126 RepID=A0ABN9SK03_9DINO|nr:unnamed protein product [Polarella glacialis]